eukprot:TRINITY_DN17320_c0_g1_i1.p1 TRINITY_DN17320_c0_g1~~TRINITY_DN17320_c0_g1_i1.p1  ORF type:complete len:558 (-),score=125.62 TRINITY_DN17320_c0_g1_i1:29-1702(-)
MKLIGGYPFVKLQLLVVEAVDILDPNQLPEKLPSFYCKIIHNGKKRLALETEVCKSTKHPKWYQEFIMYIDDISTNIDISLKCTEQAEGKKFGTTSLNLFDLKVNDRIEDWFPLQINNSQFGKLKLVCTVTPLAALPGNYFISSRKLSQFRLDLNKQEAVSGGVIEGTITLMTPLPIELSKIYLRIFGQESVVWTEEDWEVDKHYTGETTLINKWYHGWENDQKTLDAGYYNWKFRIKVPSGLPPSYESGTGKIAYHVYAYQDHQKFTEGQPLLLYSPIVASTFQQNSSQKHNMEVTCTLDKPIYFVEDSPVRLMIVTSVRNFSDYRIRLIKVRITEKATYCANNSVTTELRLLFKQSYKSVTVSGHQKWEGKLLADLPVDYATPTITKSMGATRITCTHTVKVSILKDTPFVDNKVSLSFPLPLASKHAIVDESASKKQLISLRKELVVTSPATPPVPKRSAHSSGPAPSPAPPPSTPSPSPGVKNAHSDSPPLSPRPVPDAKVDFHEALPTKFAKAQVSSPFSFSPLVSISPTNPFASPAMTNPFLQSPSPNPFL